MTIIHFTAQYGRKNAEERRKTVCCVTSSPVTPCCCRPPAAVSLQVIRRDIARTYPEHALFKQKDGLGQESLFNVMKAYSVHDREVHRKT